MPNTTLVLPNLANPAFPQAPEFLPEEIVLRHFRKLFVELETEVALEIYADWMLPHSLPQIQWED